MSSTTEAELWAVCPSISIGKSLFLGDPLICRTRRQAEYRYRKRVSGWMPPVRIRRLSSHTGGPARQSIKDFEALRQACLRPWRPENVFPLDSTGLDPGTLILSARIERLLARRSGIQDGSFPGVECDDVVKRTHREAKRKYAAALGKSKQKKPSRPTNRHITTPSEEMVTCFLASDWMFGEIRGKITIHSDQPLGIRLLEILYLLEEVLREAHKTVPLSAEIDFWASWQVWNCLAEQCRIGTEEPYDLWSDIREHLLGYRLALQVELNPNGKLVEEAAEGKPMSCDTPAFRAREKPGPKKDIKLASRIAEIIKQVVPHGDWRRHLDEVCEALDEAKIPCSKPWKKKDGAVTWCDQPDRSKVIKAIVHRLKSAE